MNRFLQRFTVHELVIMSVLAAVGIAVKPVVVPIAHVVSGPLMIPGGALAGGLYMMWIIIGYGIVKKPGTALIICIIQAILVMFTGVVGSHGIMSLATYTAPGVAVELFMILVGHRGCCLGCCAAGGMLANLAGTVTVNFAFFRVPGAYLVLMISVSALSGLAGGVIAGQLIKIFDTYFVGIISRGGENKWKEK